MPFFSSVFRPFGTDLFCLDNKFLVYNLVGRNLKLKYRQSFFGFLWSLLLPLANAAMYYVVFQLIVKIPIPNYPAFILSGVLPWAFFSQTVTDGTESLRMNAKLLSKIPLPLQVFPLIGTVSNMTTLIFAFPVILGVHLASGGLISPNLLLAPIALALMFVMAYGFALIVSVAYVYLYDLRHLITIILQMWFYATPIVYNEAMIPENMRWVIYANPFSTLVIMFRDAVIYSRPFNPTHLVVGTAWAAIVLLCGALLYRLKAKRLVEIL